MGKKRYILFAVVGLLLVALMSAALTINGDSFKRLSASGPVRWLDEEGILKVDSYQTSSQNLDYDLLHVIYDNLSLRFASTSFGPAVNMPAWPQELDGSRWSDAISGADFILASDRIPTTGLPQEISDMREDIIKASDISISRAAEYLYAVLHTSVANYAAVASLDELDAYIGGILDSQYYMCQFIYRGTNSTEMIINAIKAAMLRHGAVEISWSVADMGADGREFTVRFSY